MLCRTTTMSLRRSARVASSNVNAISTAVSGPVKTAKRAIESESASKPTKKVKKVVIVEKASEQPVKTPGAPVTPVRKKKAVSKKVSPSTPTPSSVNVIRIPYSSGDIDDATPPPSARPVDPHVSNATLTTPEGIQTTAYVSNQTGNDGSSFSPSVATTASLLEKACEHLIKVDSRMKPLIEKHRCAVFSPEGLAEEIDPFRSLSSGIMGQQVSGAAAKAIKNKFIALFNEDSSQIPTFPTPAQVAVTDIARLRLAGLSQRKAEYIQGLAEKFVNGELTNEMLMTASDDEVMERLIAVRGLGKWSVEMFACFGLKRFDILSTGDLGVQRGMAHYFGKDVQKLKAKGGGKWKYMTEQEMLDKSAPYAPYRSLFMWYMWKVEDVDVDVMNSQ